MKRVLVSTLIAGAIVTAVAGPALAWQCPVQWKAAEDAIRKAETLNVPPEGRAILSDARKLVAESKKHHNEGTTKVEHAHSMWKARAALAQAEAVITIAAP